jgi:amino acid transporter
MDVSVVKEPASTSRTRTMSPFDGFIYNFLAMGVIFPWVFLQGSATFPNAHLEVALVLALLVQLPISLAYSLLAVAMPVNGGDYIFQTRAFGGWGFIIVMSGFVIWILQWIAISGWLFATLGISPLFMTFGVHFRLPILTKLGVIVESPLGVVLVSVFLTIGTVLVLRRGMRVYVVIQRVLFGFTIAAVLAAIVIFRVNGPHLTDQINNFASIVMDQLRLAVPPAMHSDFVHFIQTDVQSFKAASTQTSKLVATLGVVSIAWTSLQWANYSVEQNSEIRGANRLRVQLAMSVFPMITVALLLIVIAFAQNRYLPSGFLQACYSAYWIHHASPQSVAFLRYVLQPFPSVLAIAASTDHIVLSGVIAVGFLANAFQVTCNCYIGVSRILEQMACDGTLRGNRTVFAVDAETKEPLAAYWIYCALSLPVIVAYSLLDAWKDYTLGIPFACGYVFIFTCLALTRLPGPRLYQYWQASEIRWMAGWVLQACGWLSAAIAFAMVASYLILPEFEIRGVVPYTILISTILLSALLYKRRSKRTAALQEVFRSLPAETHCKRGARFTS